MFSGHLFTIGVYNSTESEFFGKLLENEIDLFIDIRQRRGVRGSKYKFVNSNYLQQKLKELEIGYLYIPELAPTKEIRELQKSADKAEDQLKSERTELSKLFIDSYKQKVLASLDLGEILKSLPRAKKIVLFCVEERAEACHRSLCAQEFGLLTNSIPINL